MSAEAIILLLSERSTAFLLLVDSTKCSQKCLECAEHARRADPTPRPPANERKNKRNHFVREFNGLVNLASGSQVGVSHGEGERITHSASIAWFLEAAVPWLVVWFVIKWE